MRIIVTGGTGLIGRHLTRQLGRDGYDVVVLSRNPQEKCSRLPSGVRAVRWDAKTPDGWAHLLDHPDTMVINLAGENPANWRWTRAHKDRVLQSRLDATHAVVQAIQQAEHKPGLLLQASAVGYYGDTGDAEITENCPPGDDWRARVCVAWEAAAANAGVRTATLRIGIVLDQTGGALPPFLKAADMLGAQLGSGDQWIPWIDNDDVTGAIRFLMHDPQASGVYNITAPNPLRNRDFMNQVAAVRGRPAILPIPSLALQMAMGEQAAVVLDSQRILPQRLLEAGYTFHRPELNDALRHIMRYAHHWALMQL